VRVGAEGNGETSFIIKIYRRVPRAGGGMLCLLKCSEFDKFAKYDFIIMEQQAQWAKASSLSRIRDHTHLDTPQSLGLLWTSDKPECRNLYLTTHSTHKRQTSMPPGRFEPPIPASERSANPSLRPRGH